MSGDDDNKFIIRAETSLGALGFFFFLIIPALTFWGVIIFSWLHPFRIELYP